MVLLKMDMPKCCQECDLCCGFEEWDGCLVGGSGDSWLKDYRADDCPIIAEIPDNPTNGDVIDALFDNDIFKCCCFAQGWWDMPYKGVEE